MAMKIILVDALFLFKNKSKINKERKIYLAAEQTPMQLSQLKSLNWQPVLKEVRKI